MEPEEIMEELICPWCKKEVVVSDYYDSEYLDIECNNEDCPVQPTSMSYDTEKDAIDAWRGYG